MPFSYHISIVENGSLIGGVGGRDSAHQNAMSKAAQETGLTRRELEVLRLLARGYSDKRIADELYISPRTAMTHVSNILAKFNVNKRTAAASVALRLGIVDSIAPGEFDD